MALPQMEPGENIWTVLLASGMEQHFQLSMGTSAEENTAHCQLLTGPTDPQPPGPSSPPGDGARTRDAQELHWLIPVL